MAPRKNKTGAHLATFNKQHPKMESKERRDWLDDDDGKDADFVDPGVDEEDADDMADDDMSAETAKELQALAGRALPRAAKKPKTARTSRTTETGNSVCP